MNSETKIKIFQLEQAEKLLTSRKREDALNKEDLAAFSLAQQYLGDEYFFKTYSQFLSKLPPSALSQLIDSLKNSSISPKKTEKKKKDTKESPQTTKEESKEEEEKEVEEEEEEKKEKTPPVPTPEASASIPPDLEALVAEYRQNQVELQTEESKTRSPRSVAAQVKVAIAHSKIKEMALANRNRRFSEGETFQNTDDTFVALGSPKSESTTEALADSYNAVRLVASTYDNFNELPEEIQNEIVDSAVELNTAGITDLNTAIQTSAVQIDTSDLQPEIKENISAIPGEFVSTIYHEVTSLDQDTASTEKQIFSNEEKISQIQQTLAGLSDKERQERSLEIKSLIEKNNQLSQNLSSRSESLIKIIDEQTAAFQEKEKELQKKQSQNPDLQDIVDHANKSVASIQDRLEANGVKPHIYTPMDDAHLLEEAIRRDMPGLLLPYASYEGEYAAALVRNPKTQDKDLSPEAILLFSKELTPARLAQIRQYAIDNPTSALGDLFKNNPDIFSATSSQVNKISQSPLSKDLVKPVAGVGKAFRSFSQGFGKAVDRITGTFGKVAKFFQNPLGAFKAWAGRKAGEFMLRKILGKIANEALKKTAETLIKNGIKGAVKKLIEKAAIKGAIKLGLEAAASSTGVGILVAIAIEIGSWIFDKTVAFIKQVSISLFGEEIKARDLLAAPVLAIAGVVSVLATTTTAVVAAATSAVGTIVVSTIIVLIFYTTSFAVAPLISTLVQLDSTGTTGISSSCANTQGIFISQRDPSWSRTFCSDCSTTGSCNIGGSGCSSASMTMILNSFGLNKNVVDIWNRQHEVGGYVYWNDDTPSGSYLTTPPFQNCGSDNMNSLKMLTENGLAITDIGANMQEADRVLDNCGLLLTVGLMKCQAGWCGHLLVIVGHEGNQITTMDPWYGENYVHTLGSTYQIRRMWAVVP